MSEAEASRQVTLFRTNYPEIPQFWRSVGDKAIEAVKGAKRTHDGEDLCFDGRDPRYLSILLPSGRKLYYLNARIQKRETPFGIRDSTVFSTTGAGRHAGRRNARLETGGKHHPVNRAGLLCDGLLAAATAGFNLIGHVHDEIITEERDGSVNDAGKLEKLMSTAPGWARSLKLGAEAAKLNFYSK